MRRILVALMFAVSTSMVAADVRVGPAVVDRDDVKQNNILITVKNTSGSAVENGDLVIWKDGTLDGLEVSSTATANSKLIAGVVYPSTIADGAYGTIMVYGYHPAIELSAANTAGDCIGTSTTAEEGAPTTTVGACIATALETTASSTTVKGFVHAQ